MAHVIQLLRTTLPSCTLLPGTPEYETARNGFWSYEQSQCTPQSIVQPADSHDMAKIMKILKDTGSPFGIKSGGHGRCKGESSISDGILIDLKRLNKIQLSEDKTSCIVGPGNTWANIYSLLIPQELAVVGGRASTVGVGGFCISGGISFLSNRYGWALDNVLGFEVVLADGSIVQADPSSHPDLYKALRGGGANFGVVTELKLSVYPYKGMWGGGMNWTWEHGNALIDAFFEYGNDNVGNLDASVIFGVVNYEGQWLWHLDVEHAKSTRPDATSALQRFFEIPSVAAEIGPTSLIERTDSIVAHYPPGLCNGYWTFCTKVDKRIVKYFMDVWREEVDPIIGENGIDRVALADINFVSQNIIDAMNKNGGNVLGLNDKEPFLLFLMEPNWSNPENSPRVWKALRSIATRTEQKAKELGVHHDYIYLNYANPFQDVYSGYGQESKAFLTATSRKYDPEGIFQRQRQAGWDLSGAFASTI